MTQYNMPEDVLDYVKRLEKRVVNLEKLTRSSNTSIDSGALIIKGNDGQIIGVFGDIMKAGLIPPDGTSQMGFLFYRTDGTLALSLYDSSMTGEFGQYIGLFDQRQEPLLLEDFRTGYGLARPFFAGPPIYNPDPSMWPATTSSAFVGSQEAWMFFNNPGVYVDFLMNCSAADTTGEARLMINGVQYGPTISGGFGYSSFNQKLLLPESLVSEQWYNVNIQHRRTAGTGSVATAYRILYNTQKLTA